NRRRSRRLSAATIDDKATGLEGRHSDRRPCAPTNNIAELDGAEFVVFQRSKRDTDRQCELGAGTKAGVGRNGSLNIKVKIAFDTQGGLEMLECPRAAFLFNTFHLVFGGAAKDQLSCGAFQCKSDRAEQAAQTTVQIENAQ